MKLPAAVLAALCAAGCEAAYVVEPTYPTQPVEEYEVADPRLETVAPVEFAKPPEPGVAPIRPEPVRRVVPVAPTPPLPLHIDDCPGCGMG